MDERMPRWELTDPFGRGEIRHCRYEYRRLEAENRELQAQLAETMTEQAAAVRQLAAALEKEQARCDELNRRLDVCDKARKSLGEKLRVAAAEIVRLRGDQHDDT